MVKRIGWIGLLIAALLLAACAPQAEQTPEAPAADDTDAVEATASADAAGEDESSDAEAVEEPLRVALLPILDVLPFYVAEQNGYFAEEGVTVQAVPVASAVEREQLMQAGEIDGMLNELHSTALNNREGRQVVSVMTARAASAEAPLFRVLAAPESGIASPADLAGVPVGISENTIIEYVTQRLLEAEGVPAADVVPQPVPSIPERYQLLMEGQIDAATLPDPLAQSAVEDGAVLVIDDSAHPEYAVSVLTFSADAVDNRTEDVRAFLRAWDRAAADINAAPEAYRALLLEKVQVPPNVQETYEVPPYPRAEVPTAEQWADVTAWLVEKGLVQSAPGYEESVSGALLP